MMYGIDCPVLQELFLKGFFEYQFNKFRVSFVDFIPYPVGSHVDRSQDWLTTFCWSGDNLELKPIAQAISLRLVRVYLWRPLKKNLNWRLDSFSDIVQHLD